MGIKRQRDGAGDRLRRGAKRALYRAARAVGLFRLARRLMRKGLRILCYHGVAMDDEARFSPHTFITPETLRERLDYLADQKYPVLGLEDAVTRLRKKDLPPGAVVITFDDGFYSTAAVAVPMLRERRQPVTIYVTTYHCIKETPGFQLLIQYMFWKSPRTEVDFGDIGGLDLGPVSLDDKSGGFAMGMLMGLGGDGSTEPERCNYARQIGERLGVDYDEIVRSRLMSVVTTEEVRRLAAEGVDIQLHTHRHRFPADEAAVLKEIADNRAVLEPLVGRPLRHFCYPSGVYHPAALPWLAAAGVETATTCVPGLNYAKTPRLLLRRFLDGENISQIEFEAEVSGFAEVMRRLRRALRWAAEGPQ
jgi:peptidoglycan/xylan/chitin deacetylase (PgdA/CDA1 family)